MPLALVESTYDAVDQNLLRLVHNQYIPTHISNNISEVNKEPKLTHNHHTTK